MEKFVIVCYLQNQRNYVCHEGMTGVGGKYFISYSIDPTEATTFPTEEEALFYSSKINNPYERSFVVEPYQNTNELLQPTLITTKSDLI